VAPRAGARHGADAPPHQKLVEADQYLNIESAVLQAGTIQLGWLSAMWTLSPPVANPTRTILETTYRNPPFNTSSPSWARDLVHGKLLYPSGPTANQIYQVEGWVSRNYTPNEWTQIFNPDEDYEVDAVGLSGRAVVNGNGLSTNDNVFLHRSEPIGNSTSPQTTAISISPRRCRIRTSTMTARRRLRRGSLVCRLTICSAWKLIMN
jgi:hypothetical protein